MDDSLAGVPAPNPNDLSLATYLAILRRQWPLALGILGSLLAATLVYSLLKTPTYEASATVLLRTESNQQVFPAVGESQRASFTRQPEAELEYAESDAFETLMAGLTPEATTVTPEYRDLGVTAIGARRSNLLGFVARSSNPEDARIGADLWAQTYVSSRHELSRSEIESTIGTTTELIERLDEQKAIVLEPLTPLDAALAAAIDPDVISRLTTQRLALQQTLAADTGPIDAQLRVLRDDLAALRISDGFLQREDISARVSGQAAEAVKVGPLLFRNLAIAAVIGMILALGAAPLRDNLQTKLTTVSDIEAVSGGIPVLAELPPFGENFSHPSEPALDFGTPYVESLERLVTAIGLLNMSSEGSRILITSPMPSEGKTTVAAHLALRLGMASVKTAVVDADLRRPNLHNLFGMQNDGEGLRSVLTGHAEVFASLRKASPAIDLDVLLAGPPTITPASLVRSPAALATFEKLSSENSVVIIDSPPTLPVTDSQALAAHAVDHVIVVVRSGRSNRQQLAETIEKLIDVGARPTGIVLTESKKAVISYGYHYADDAG